MTDGIDWAALGRRLGTTRDLAGRGHDELVGTRDAWHAIEILLDEDNLRAAVDHYISGKPGGGLARSILWQIHSWSAVQYCYQIHKSGRSIEARRSAVELLRVIADERALPWVDEFLVDGDEEIQVWGAGVLDQLLWSKLVDPQDAEPLIAKLETHASAGVRDRAEFIRGFLKDRSQLPPDGDDGGKPTA